jgi:hypothetical protein
MFMLIQTWVAFTSALVFSETSLLCARLTDQPEPCGPLALVCSLAGLAALVAAISVCIGDTLYQIAFSTCLVHVNLLFWVHFCKLRQQVVGLFTEQRAAGLFLRKKMVRQQRYVILNSFEVAYFVIDLMHGLATTYEGQKFAPCTSAISWHEAYHILAFTLIVANNVLYAWASCRCCINDSQKADLGDVCTEELCVLLVRLTPPPRLC